MIKPSKQCELGAVRELLERTREGEVLVIVPGYKVLHDLYNSVPGVFVVLYSPDLLQFVYPCVTIM